MPFTKIWIHLIFSTKNREPYLLEGIKEKVITHIKDNSKDKNIFISEINGDKDHIHILLSLGNEQSVAKVAQLIKGESSFWIKKNKITKFKFEWQEEYIALSVSESVVDKVREYIRNQEEHHRVKTFKEEFDLFIRKFGLG